MRADEVGFSRSIVRTLVSMGAANADAAANKLTIMSTA
jgi:hypothetical protein